MTRKSEDREKLYRDILERAESLPLDLVRRFYRVISDVAKGTAVDDALADDEQRETDQQRGERLGTRTKSESPIGKGPGGGLVFRGHKTERPDD